MTPSILQLLKAILLKLMKKSCRINEQIFIKITKKLNLKTPIINTTNDITSLTKNYKNRKGK